MHDKNAERFKKILIIKIYKILVVRLNKYDYLIFWLDLKYIIFYKNQWKTQKMHLKSKYSPDWNRKI